MSWWIWVLIAFALFGAELATTTLHLAFFGAGALLVALVVALGGGGPLWFQLLLFTTASIVLLLFRSQLLHLVRPAAGDHPVDSLVGESAMVLEDISIQGTGKAELRGSAWSARNIGERPIARGERCLVERVEGLTLMIRAS